MIGRPAAGEEGLLAASISHGYLEVRRTGNGQINGHVTTGPWGRVLTSKLERRTWPILKFNRVT